MIPASLRATCTTLLAIALVRALSGEELLLLSLSVRLEERHPGSALVRVRDATTRDGRSVAEALAGRVVLVALGGDTRVSVLREDHDGRDIAVVIGLPVLAFIVGFAGTLASF